MPPHVSSISAQAASSFIAALLLRAGHTAHDAFRTKKWKHLDACEPEVITTIDVLLQNEMTDSILSFYPQSRIVAEESDAQKHLCGQGLEWIIDPLDGTRNYASGIPTWCHLLALHVDGAPVAAGAYEPLSGDLFIASAGEGTYLNGTRVYCRDTQSLTNAHGLCVCDRTGEAHQTILGLLVPIGLFHRAWRSACTGKGPARPG